MTENSATEIVDILIIEDSEADLFLIQNALQNNRYRLKTIDTGFEAYLFLSDTEKQPDIVLLDYYLPEMNGIEILEKIDKNKCTSSFIFLTVEQCISTVVKAMKAGALDFVVKNMNLATELPHKIEKVYEIHKILHLNKKIERELRLAKERAEESEQKYKNLIQHLPSIVYRFSNKRGGLFWSDKVKDILGISPQEILENPFLWNERIHPDDKILVQNAIADHQKGAAFNIEYRIQTTWGEWIWLHDFFMHKEQIGDEIIIEGYATEITLRKEAEIRIQQQNKQLAKLNDDKDHFLSILAHDLRSPFNGILGFLELMIDNIHRYDIKKIENQLHIINNSSLKVFKMLEDILAWARAQAGQIPFKPMELNLKEICNEIIGVLEQNASAKNIKINMLIKNEQMVFADLNMLKTIVRNLISNALKFTQTGGEILLSALEMNNEIAISVSDNGTGIEADALGKLFDISQKYSQSGTLNETGSGLGLILCKEFVQKHGGKIWVESQVGVGSTFTFTLLKNI